MGGLPVGATQSRRQMYRAELHGKLSREVEGAEDILTSNVFGFLCYSDREQFLQPYLATLGLPVSAGAARAARFEFWPSYADGTEPDLVLHIGPYYVLVEAKLGSDFQMSRDPSLNQLVRELTNGRDQAARMGKEPRLLTITAEPFAKSLAYGDLQVHRDVWLWTNWQSLTQFLLRSPATSASPMATDLLELLMRKNLRGFDGFANLRQAPRVVRAGRLLRIRAESSHASRGLERLKHMPRIVPVNRLFYGPQ